MTMRAVLDGPGIPKPVGPYSPAIVANGVVYCAGQIALGSEPGKLVSTDLAEQTTQVMKNLNAVLQGAGSSFEKVVMTTIFLTDISYGKVVSEIYSRYVNPTIPPARQTVAVKDLPLGALVEISVIALV